MNGSTSSGVALILIGASIMGTLFMGVVATENFYTIDRLLTSLPNASFKGMVEDFGPGRSREFLRYLSSEMNRLLFQAWGWAELALGAVICLVLWRTPQRKIRYAAFGMLAVVVLMTVVLIPPIVTIGRQLDFVPREPPPSELGRFGLLHAAYTIMDGVKLVLAGVLAFGLIRHTAAAEDVSDLR